MTNIAGQREFERRILTGWLSEYSNQVRLEPWPKAPLDRVMQADLDAYFDLCRETGFTGVVLWGLFVDWSWPLDITSCCDSARREAILQVIEAAHARKLKLYAGVGIYSWGYDGIIAAHPHLSRGNEHALCPSVPESHVWVQRILDFVMGDFPFDGLNLQSADLKRCPCPDCAARAPSDLAYHVRLNRRVAHYVHSRWPDARLIVDNWGCDLGDESIRPEDRAELAALARAVDCIVDPGNSAQKRGRPYRRQLIAELDCPFGTLGGRSIWPPQRWEKDRWFLPTMQINVPYIRNLHEDGGRAAEQFVTTLANPSGEITLRFMGGLLADVDAEPERLLASAVEATYDPADTATRDALARLVAEAEQAYFRLVGTEIAVPDLYFVDAGFLSHEEPDPPTYLQKLTSAGRHEYASAISALAAQFESLRPRIGRTEKAEQTARCLLNILADLRAIKGMP